MLKAWYRFIPSLLVLAGLCLSSWLLINRLPEPSLADTNDLLLWTAVGCTALGALLWTFFWNRISGHLLAHHQFITESQRRFRDIFLLNSSPMFILNKGRIIDANPSAESLYGISRKDLLKLKFSDLNANSCQQCSLLESHLEAALSGVPQHYSWQQCKGTGQHFDAEITLLRSFMDLNETICAVIRDISAEQKLFHENRLLAAAVEHAGESVVISSDQGIIEYVNASFERITGYTRSEVLGKNARILKSAAHDPSFYRDLWSSLEAHGTWYGHIVNRRKNGETYTEQMSIAPGLPIVFATGHSYHHLQDGLAPSISVVHKPYNPRTLLSTLQKALHNSPS